MLLVDRHRTLLASNQPKPQSYKCPSGPSFFVQSVSMNNRRNPARFVQPVLVVGGWETNFMV